MSHFLLGYSYRQGERITPTTQSMFIESSNLVIEREQKGLGYEKSSEIPGFLVLFSKIFLG